MQSSEVLGIHTQPEWGVLLRYLPSFLFKFDGAFGKMILKMLMFQGIYKVGMEWRILMGCKTKIMHNAMEGKYFFSGFAAGYLFCLLCLWL
jgi:hypothetical protein